MHETRYCTVYPPPETSSHGGCGLHVFAMKGKLRTKPKTSQGPEEHGAEAQMCPKQPLLFSGRHGYQEDLLSPRLPPEAPALLPGGRRAEGTS